MLSLGVFLTGLALGPGGVPLSDFVESLSLTAAFPISYPLGLNNIVVYSTEAGDYYCRLICFLEYIPLLATALYVRYGLLAPYFNSIQPQMLNKKNLFSETIGQTGTSVRDHFDTLTALGTEFTPRVRFEFLAEVASSQSKSITSYYR